MPDKVIDAAMALGFLYSASSIMSNVVGITKDKDGEYDPDVWKIHLDLTRVVSKYSDRLAKMKRMEANANDVEATS